MLCLSSTNQPYATVESSQLGKETPVPFLREGDEALPKGWNAVPAPPRPQEPQPLRPPRPLPFSVTTKHCFTGPT